jgi:hypothetical protein
MRRGAMWLGAPVWLRCVMVEQHRFNVMSDRRIRMAECEIGRQATWLSVVSAKAVIFGLLPVCIIAWLASGR